MTKKIKKKEEQKKEEQSFAFDMAKFQSAQYEDRIDNIHVPEMVDFYPEGTKPMIKVKGLTAEELAKSEYEVSLNRQTINEMNKLNVDDNTISALRTIMRSYGTEDTPDNHVKMLNFVRIGMLEPKMNHDEVIKFSNVFPIEFRQVYIKIAELTGRGSQALGKPKGSGKKSQPSK